MENYHIYIDKKCARYALLAARLLLA